jgi:hypothetical protein
MVSQTSVNLDQLNQRNLDRLARLDNVSELDGSAYRMPDSKQVSIYDVQKKLQNLNQNVKEDYIPAKSSGFQNPPRLPSANQKKYGF